MTGDRWTFLVVRGEDTPVRQYTVSARALRAVVGVGAVVALVLFGLGLTAATDATARIRSRQLQARNEALHSELQRFRTSVSRLESTVNQLTEKDARIRTVAGLDAIDPEVLEVGVGGPGLGSLESYPLWSVDSAAAKDAYAVSYDLNALQRRARLLAISLDEANDSLRAHQDLLESTPSILPTSGLLSSRFSKSRMHPIHNRALPTRASTSPRPRARRSTRRPTAASFVRDGWSGTG